MRRRRKARKASEGREKIMSARAPGSPFLSGLVEKPSLRETGAVFNRSRPVSLLPQKSKPAEK
jgi:hypothetical protein